MQWRLHKLEEGCHSAYSHGLLVMTHVVGAVHQTHTGESKVSQLDVSIAGYQQVVWLQVSMDDALHHSNNHNHSSNAFWHSKTTSTSFCEWMQCSQGQACCLTAHGAKKTVVELTSQAVHLYTEAGPILITGQTTETERSQHSAAVCDRHLDQKTQLATQTMWLQSCGLAIGSHPPAGPPLRQQH